MKFKVGDIVKITIGKDRAKTGAVKTVLPKKNMVIVEGVNLYKKHLKNRGQNQKGGIIDLFRPLNLAKIALICPKCHKATRVGFSGKGLKKIRICKKCQKPID